MIFVVAFTIVPLLSSMIYYLILQSWYENPVQAFYDIKQVLVRHGELSDEAVKKFSNDDISSNKTYVEQAVSLGQHELGPWYLIPKLILPLIVVLGIFTIFTFSFWVPGVTTHINEEKQGENEQYLDHLPSKTLDFLSDYNRAIVSVGGFIIAILGGFLISSGLNNFYFFLGFETIILSLIASLLAYTSFISSITKQEPIVIDISRFIGFFKVSCFAGWFLILGLILLATDFS